MGCVLSADTCTCIKHNILLTTVWHVGYECFQGNHDFYL